MHQNTKSGNQARKTIVVALILACGVMLPGCASATKAADVLNAGAEVLAAGGNLVVRIAEAGASVCKECANGFSEAVAPAATSDQGVAASKSDDIPPTEVKATHIPPAPSYDQPSGN